MQIHLALLLSDWLIYGLFIIAVIAFFMRESDAPFVNRYDTYFKEN